MNSFKYLSRKDTKYMKHTHSPTPHGQEHAHHAFDDPEYFAKQFDAPERDVWQKPAQVIASLNLPDDATVAEIGAGTGYFTVRLAKHVKKGKVIVVESSPKMAAYLENRVQELSLLNVDVLISQADNQVSLPEQVDLIMCVDVYHHITDRVAYFAGIQRQLKPHGKIAIIDLPADSPVAPPHRHQTPPAVVEEEMKRAGLELVQTFDFLLPHQFYLVFKRTTLG